MNYSEVIDQISLIIPSDLKSLDQILAHLEKINYQIISRQTWLECQLALVEGFTNAVRHAHKDLSPEVTIEIKINLFGNRLELYIWDRGNPFDLESFMAKSPLEQNDLSLGGRGLIILRQIADFISYTREEDERNCLLIIKYFSH